MRAASIFTPSPDTPVGAKLPANGVLFQWLDLDATDPDGAPVLVGDFADMCVQIDGTFGTASCTLQGSNDGSNWYPLTDVQAAAITKSSAGLEQVAECPLYVRPLASSTDGTTSINVRLFGRRGRI